MSTGDFPESLSQAMLVRIMLVGRLGVRIWIRGIYIRTLYVSLSLSLSLSLSIYIYIYIYTYVYMWLSQAASRLHDGAAGPAASRRSIPILLNIWIIIIIIIIIMIISLLLLLLFLFEAGLPRKGLPEISRLGPPSVNLHVYIYIYIYTHIHIHICTYTYMYIYYTHTYRYIYIYTYIHTYIHITVHVHIYIYIYIYRERDIYIYTHTPIPKFTGWANTHVNNLRLTNSLERVGATTSIIHHYLR